MIVYLIKSTTCLAIFFLFYKLFLEKENMHIFKRFYLLGILVASFCIPLITFTNYVSVVPMQELAMLDQNMTIATNDSTGIVTNYLPMILWTVYSFGVILFVLKFALNIYKILVKIYKNPHHKTKSFINVLLEDLATPHTFFSYIFLDKYKFEAKKIPQEVIIHEQTHAKQKHSLDVLLIELILIVFWFNPIFYLVKHAIKLNHEFLADQAVLNRGTNTSVYQKILLNFSSTDYHPKLTNAINYSFIKKRFTIMKTQTSKKTSWLRSLILLPLLTVLIYGFSEKITIEKLIPQIQKTTNNSQLKDVEIAINKSKTILLNGEKYVTLENLTEEVKKVVSIYSPDQLKNVKVWIQADGTLNMAFITEVKQELIKTGIVRYKHTYTFQNKATLEQISEYNNLAKKYNAMSKDRFIVELKDVERIRYIYDLMTLPQRKKAEPFPNFPPPPTAPKRVYQGEEQNIIPPPPAPAPFVVHGKAIKDIPPPSSPPNPLDHIIELAKKGATFYYEDDKISSDKAIEIVKKNKSTNIQIRDHDSKNSIVKLSKKPIVVTGKLDPKWSSNYNNYMREMNNKGAHFYFEGEKISLDQVLKIKQEFGNINMLTKDVDTKKPLVILSRKEITTKDLKNIDR